VIIANLDQLRTSGDVRDREVVVIGGLPLSTSDLAVEYVLAETRFLRKSAGKTHAIDGFESLVHSTNRLEATSDVRPRLREDRSDQLRKLEEETLALLGRLALVSKCELLVRTASKFDKVKLVLLKNLANLLSLFWVQAFLLKFD
jgi:hypothetical protein